MFELRRIVYISRSARPLSNVEIDTLVTSAAACNVAANITGLLLYDGVQFIQAIEGPPIGLEALIHRIEADDRHYSVVRVEDCKADFRCFGSWSMRYERVGGARFSSSFVKEVVAAVSGISDLYVQAMFIGFAALSR